jgi:tRNA(adenine34) deaminase
MNYLTDQDDFFMEQALRQARKAYEAGEVPVGAVIVHEGQIIARSHNQVEMLKDGTAHAEMIALTQAQEAMGDRRLNACTIYVTKEPCPMCAGALVQCRMGRVVYGVGDPKYGAGGGALNLLQFEGWNHDCQISSGVQQERSLELLQSFFQEQRLKSKKRLIEE